MAAAMSSALWSPAHLVLPSLSGTPGLRNSGRVCVISCSQASPSSSSSSSSKSIGEQSQQKEEKWLASRRDIVAGSISAISAGLFAFPALALLETDDDESLLEKVKEDRRKRIEKRGVVASFKSETESVQKAVYELSKAGQAIDGEDYGLATSVLGSTDDGWIKEVKAAIFKVSRNAEEEGEAANFSAALQELQSAVSEKNSELSKSAFVASANALEKWSSLTGFFDQIKGL
ncbi:unnamed protein product [Calypogeia fissa]